MVVDVGRTSDRVESTGFRLKRGCLERDVCNNVPLNNAQLSVHKKHILLFRG